MGTFILKRNEQMVPSFPIGRLKRLEDNAGTGGGAAADFVDNEVVSGSGTSFTLANAPIAGSVKLHGRGQRLKVTTDYSITGSAITTVDSWAAGDLIADYRK